MNVCPCSCGAMPKAEVYRVAEDLMGAQATCVCGKSAPEIEHVWGGQEAREMALAEWNAMRVAELNKAPKRDNCRRNGCDIVWTRCEGCSFHVKPEPSLKSAPGGTGQPE